MLAASFAGAASINEQIGVRYTKLGAFYQDLHRHPELGFKETRTAAKVAEEFKRLGFETIENVGGGVVGIYQNGEGPVTMVRFELDALPITEETNLPYKSETPGVMHACGHDLHATATIGAADLMINAKKDWKGTLVLVGQPAEESLSGAKAMIEAGIFSKIPKPNYIVGIHTRGAVPTGKLAFASGPVQAASNNLDIIFRGIGTHGAAPHRGVDPIIIASEFVLKMQTLNGRENDPMDPAVITVGSFGGGTRPNIVATEVKLQMTMRTYNMVTRARLLKRVEETSKNLAKNAGAPEPTVAVVESAPILVNERYLTERFRKAVTDAMGADQVVDIPRVMTSEDFGLFGETAAVPSMKYYIGTAAASGPTIDNHNSKFAPNVKVVLPLTMKSMFVGLMDLYGGAKMINPLANEPVEEPKKISKTSADTSAPNAKQKKKSKK